MAEIWERSVQLVAADEHRDQSGESAQSVKAFGAIFATDYPI
jgi:hypothetical protein